MKSLALIIAALLLGTPAFAQTPEAISPNIVIQLQMVVLPRKTAAPLVQDFMVEAKVEAANAKVQELIANGEAKLVGWPMLITKSGQRAQVENVHEIRYPTEFDPGGVAIHLKDKDGVLSKQRIEVDGLEVNPTPTSFETRNAGSTLQAEAVLSPDGKIIDLNLEPHHVIFRGMRKVKMEHPNGAKTEVEVADFDTLKTQTALVMRNGQRMLLAMFPVDEPPDHLELFILKVETRQP